MRDSQTSQIVLALLMLVAPVSVGAVHRVVHVFVVVPLGDVQPDAEGLQGAGDPE